MDSAIPKELLPPRRGADGETELGPPYGETVQLPSGGGAVTHYCLERPSSNAGDPHTVVLINGINDFSVRYAAMAAALAEAGFTVLRYDGYGRGWSSVPAQKKGKKDATRLKFDMAMHLKQLEELVAHLGLDPQHAAMSLVGHSMGGLTATHFARAHPQLRGMVLLAPAGVMKSPAFGFGCLQWAFPRLLTKIASGGPSDPPPGDFSNSGASVSVKERVSGPDRRTGQSALEQWDLDWHRAHSKANGKRAFAKSVAKMPLLSNKATLRGIAEASADMKVLLLHADNDPHVKLRPRDVQVYRDIFGDRLATMLFEGAGHCFFLQYPEKAAQSVVEFLKAS